MIVGSIAYGCKGCKTPMIDLEPIHVGAAWLLRWSRHKLVSDWSEEQKGAMTRTWSIVWAPLVGLGMMEAGRRTGLNLPHTARIQDAKAINESISDSLWAVDELVGGREENG